MVQWLRLHPCNIGGSGSIPAQGIKVPHAMHCSQNIFFLSKIEKRGRKEEKEKENLQLFYLGK